MATSSRPFQSQTVARLLGGWRQFAQGGGRWLRQGRTATVWALQVAVYPLYVAVQGLRLASRRLAASRPWRSLRALLSGNAGPARPALTPDLPIRALLSVVQPPVLGGGLVRAGSQLLVNRYGQWLQQSQAGAVLTPGQWHLVPLQQPIRGIASSLSDRQIVLVTTTNEMFTGLTADQRLRLQRAIVLMVAEYQRQQRDRPLPGQPSTPWLPLPQAQPRLLLPLRWLPAALRWMQLSPLAAATNLFGEAQQQRAIARWQHSPAPISARPGAPSAVADRISPHPTAAAGRPWGYSLPGWPALIPGAGGAAVEGGAGAVAGAETTEVLGTEIVQTAPTAVSIPGASPVSIVQPSRGAIAPMASSAELAAPTKLAAPALANPQGKASLEPLPALPVAEAIEAEVVHVAYVDSPLVAVLRGLDWVLFAIELRLRQIWDWLRRHW